MDGTVTSLARISLPQQDSHCSTACLETTIMTEGVEVGGNRLAYYVKNYHRNYHHQYNNHHRHYHYNLVLPIATALITERTRKQ